MRVAVISDIHANFPALERVLDAVRRERPDAMVCLGDIVGYNADPGACVDAIRSLSDCTVAGNHDRDLLRDRPAAGTRAEARYVQRWTREALSAPQLHYLRELPNIGSFEGLTLAHGCYLNDWYYTGYVTTTMLERNLAVVARRADLGPVALCGHTHVPMCGFLRGDDVTERSLDDVVVWPADVQAVLINPGSVGQPRDADPRAAFALIDLRLRRVTVRRVKYDISSTVAPMQRAGFPKDLMDRLEAGR